MSKNNKDSFFEFSSDNEAMKFHFYYQYIHSLTEKHINQINLKVAHYQSKMYTAKKAFEIMLSLMIENSTSFELLSFYKELCLSKDLDLEISEIILDSLYDSARHRSLKEEATVQDRDFFLAFESYGDQCSYLMTILDGMVNGLMSLFENPSASFEERKIQFIKESLPVLESNIQKILAIEDQEYYDKWLIHYIALLKTDLQVEMSSSNTNFRNFLTDNERAKIKNMDINQIQQFLASAAILNPALREAKNILKKVGELEFYINSIEKIIQKLNITDHQIKESNEFAKEQNKILMETIKYEPTEFLG